MTETRTSLARKKLLFTCWIYSTLVKKYTIINNVKANIIIAINKPKDIALQLKIGSLE